MTSTLRRARPYWRIGVVALLGGLIAFLASFLVEETYASSTRLLIRGREATFLTTSGDDLSRQPGVIDSSLAKTLGQTQAGLLTSREVAEVVVDELDLENRPKQSGVVAALARGSADLYRCTRALLTFGFCRDADPREKAIGTVQGGLMASPLDNSYVLEVVGTADEPALARDITDTAADALVALNAERSRSDAEEHAAFLDQQVETARTDVDEAAAAVRDFKAANDITDLDQQLVLTASGIDALRTRLAQTEAELQGAQARLASLQASVASAPTTDSGTQQIITGRGRTEVSTSNPSPAFSEAVRQRDAAAADVARLQAEQATLAQQVAGLDAGDLPAEQAELLQLEQQLTLAQSSLGELTAERQSALISADQGRADLTRIDSASLPTYPVAPKRYLYLALGLLLGGLAGAGLTWLAFRRPEGDDELIDELVAMSEEHDDASSAVRSEADIDLRTARSVFSRPGVGVTTGDTNGTHGA